MCGIAALFSWRGHALAPLVRGMAEAVRHRGPDSEGYALFSSKGASLFGGEETPEEVYRQPLNYCPKGKGEGGGAFALGHRRLSIVDLRPHGHQPMCDARGRYWIAYNGEIYNYRELKAELDAAGYFFRSESDTEVLLYGFIHWGKAFLHRLNGMFSFLLYDALKRELFAARDRFGIKPLYYWTSPEGLLAFASEIKQFFRLPGWRPRADRQAVYDFLSWGITNHSERTCFKGVFQLYGGHFLSLSLGGEAPSLRPERWYRLAQKEVPGTFSEAAEGFSSLLRDSVSLRCRSEVPLGSCLSGGLDSSSIVCLVNECLVQSGKRAFQSTFSSCSEHPEFDERVYADEVISRIGAKAHYVTPSLDKLFFDLDELIWSQEEPFGSTGIFAQKELFASAKGEGVKVMLDGQGADEQLGGYREFIGSRLFDLLSKGELFPLGRELFAWGPASLFRLIPLLLPSRLESALRRLFRRQVSDPGWMNLEGLQLRDPRKAASKGFQALSFSQITEKSLPMLLHFEDRNSMAHSIEARTPFLDYRLVEFTFSLPPEFKLASGLSKRVLREAMRGVLPEAVRMRRGKLGFATSEAYWIREKSELFCALVDRSALLSEGLLDRGACAKVAREIASGKRPFSFLLWRLALFGRWLERFSLSL